MLISSQGTSTYRQQPVKPAVVDSCQSCQISCGGSSPSLKVQERSPEPIFVGDPQQRRLLQKALHGRKMPCATASSPIDLLLLEMLPKLPWRAGTIRQCCFGTTANWCNRRSPNSISTFAQARQTTRSQFQEQYCRSPMRTLQRTRPTQKRADQHSGESALKLLPTLALRLN